MIKLKPSTINTIKQEAIMPLIEVDKEVWEHLQEKARPLGITSNDVLRTVLKVKPNPEKQPKVIRLTPKKDRIKQKDLVPIIIKILKENGGTATKEYVNGKIFQLFKDVFEQPYYQQKVSRNIPRWKHNIAWAKEIAKNMGLIEPPISSGRGIWKLTEKGYK
jgi:hypothetical protein